MYAHRRHDICDRVWENIQAHLPGKKGSVGRPADDNRLFINAVFWILRTGAPWRDLPPTLETGKIPIAGSVVGETGAFGKNSLRCS